MRDLIETHQMLDVIELAELQSRQEKRATIDGSA